jgi:hypothetical protein
MGVVMIVFPWVKKIVYQGVYFFCNTFFLGFRKRGGYYKLFVYRNNLNNRFLALSAWQHLFGLHSRLAIGKGRLLQTQKSAPPPCPIPDSPGYFGIAVFMEKMTTNSTSLSWTRLSLIVGGGALLLSRNWKFGARLGGALFVLGRGIDHITASSSSSNTSRSPQEVEEIVRVLWRFFQASGWVALLAALSTKNFQFGMRVGGALLSLGTGVIWLGTDDVTTRETPRTTPTAFQIAWLLTKVGCIAGTSLGCLFGSTRWGVGIASSMAAIGLLAFTCIEKKR